MNFNDPRTNWKYIVVVLFCSFIAIVIIYSVAFIELKGEMPTLVISPNRISSFNGKNISLSAANIVFDLYAKETERPLWAEPTEKFFDVISVPKIINYGDTEKANKFRLFVFANLYNPEGFNIDNLNDYIKLGEDLPLEDTSEAIEAATKDIRVFTKYLPVAVYITDNKIISLVFNYDSVGGAHPISGKIALNYNLVTGQQVNLEDSLTVGEDGVLALIRERIMKQLQTEDTIAPDIPRDVFPCDSISFKLSGFYLKDKELVAMIVGNRLDPIFCYPDREFSFTFGELGNILKLH